MEGAREYDQIVALAGLCQSCRLVQQIAREGGAHEPACRASLTSVFRIDAESADAVFGGRDGIRYGLDVLTRYLNGSKSPMDVEISRYSGSLMFLERRLARRPEKMQAIREGIETVSPLFETNGPCDEAVHEQLARIYETNVSIVGPRILVYGESDHLRDPANARLIRSLLLAGLRSTVLWRQSGGGRIGLMLGRRRLADRARALVAMSSD